MLPIAGADFQPESFADVIFPASLAATCFTMPISVTIIDDDVVEVIELLELEASYITQSISGREAMIRSEKLTLSIQDNGDSKYAMEERRCVWLQIIPTKV